MAKGTGKFILGGLLGALAGAIGGLLLAPKSGRETREDIVRLANELSKRVKSSTSELNARVREVFGNTNKAAVEKYKHIRTAVMDKAASVRSAGQAIDKDKYAMIVDDIIAEYKTDFEKTKNGATKMAELLKKDWLKIKKALS